MPETITHYELQRLLEAIPALVAKIPAIIERNLKDTCEATIPDVIARINRTIETCKTFEETLTAREDELCLHIEAMYAKVAAAHKSLTERIAALPTLPQQIDIPFNYKELLDFTERSSRLTPQAWDRMIAIANALRDTP